MSNYNWEDRLKIREAYRNWKPNTSPYSYFDWRFSPAEFNFWSDVRSLGLPLYPEYPVLGYFIDFADPVHKVGFEVDGYKFHTYPNQVLKDFLRQREIEAEGWKIIRVPAYKTKADYYMIEKSYIDDLEKAQDMGDYETEEAILQQIKNAQDNTAMYILKKFKREYYE